MLVLATVAAVDVVGAVVEIEVAVAFPRSNDGPVCHPCGLGPVGMPIDGLLTGAIDA
jgi:hypothetical protein